MFNEIEFSANVVFHYSVLFVEKQSLSMMLPPECGLCAYTHKHSFSWNASWITTKKLFIWSFAKNKFRLVYMLIWRYEITSAFRSSCKSFPVISRFSHIFLITSLRRCCEILFGTILKRMISFQFHELRITEPIILIGMFTIYCSVAFSIHVLLNNVVLKNLRMHLYLIFVVWALPTQWKCLI